MLEVMATWCTARRSVAAGARLSRRLHRRRSHSGDRGAQPIGLEGIDEPLVQYYKKKGEHLKDLELLPEGGAGCWSSSAARPRKRPRTQARGLMESSGTSPNRADHEAVRRSREEEDESGKCANRAWAPPRWCPASRDTGPAGRIPPCRRRTSATTCATCASSSTSTATILAFYGHFGQGCIHCRVHFDLYQGRHRTTTGRFMDEATDLVVALRRLAFRRTRRRPGAGAVPAEDVRRGDRAGLPRVQAHLGPGVEDESGQGGRSLPRGRRTCGWAPTTARRTPRPISSIPDDHGSFAHATLRCVGVGKCRREERRHDVPQLHGDARREAFHPRPGAPAVRNAAAAIHSTDGWKSEAVKRSARSVPGLQRLQGRLPGQCGHGHLQGGVPRRTTTRGRLRPRHAYALGLIYWWARLASHRAARWSISSPDAGLSRMAKWLGGIAQERTHSALRPETFTAGSRAGRKRNRRRAGRCCSGRTRSTTTSIRKSPRPRSRCSSMPGFR